MPRAARWWTGSTNASSPRVATVLDAPVEYTGPAYGGGYYAVFFADPDGLKLEVVHHAPSNP